MLFRSAHKFNMIILFHQVWTIKLLLMVIYMIWCVNLSAQKKRTLELFAGPNLTNVQHIVNGEKLFFTTPERPFYTINYHFGAFINEGIFAKEDLSISYGLSFDKRASANTSFNKLLDEGYGFLGSSVLLKYKPLKNQNICLEIGTKFQYIIHNSKYAYLKAFKNFEFDYIIGIQYKLWKNIHVGTRFLEPLYIMRDKSNLVSNDPIVPKDISQIKTHSVELLIIYNLKIR